MSFLIYALPRSRTAWCSRYLTYRDWTCSHEQAIVLRSCEAIFSLFRRPNHGSAETAVSPGMVLIRAACPGLREVVILRPVEEVIASLTRFDLSQIGARYDVDLLWRNMSYMRRCLEKIAQRPGTLTLDYAELGTEDGAKALFEHCLPYKFDPAWWSTWKDRNVQIDVVDHIRYALENRDAVDACKRDAKVRLRQLVRGMKEAA